jgi:hypothetical protein
VCASVPLLNVPDWEVRKARLAAEVREAAGPEGALALTEGYAMVSVVGDGLTSGASLARFLDVLAPLVGGGGAGGSVPARVIAGPLRLSALVPSAGLAEAQRELHAAFR